MQRTDFKVNEITALDIDLDGITKGFLAVKIRSLFPETALPCDVFCLKQGGKRKGIGLGKLFSKEQICNASLHSFLIAQEVDEAYIKSEDEEPFNEYFNLHSQEALSCGRISAEKKAQLLYDQAEYLVKKVFRERPTRENIGLGQQLVAQFSNHVLTDHVTSQAMLSLFSKDYYTFTHCIQVAFLGMSFCRFLGWKTRDVEDFGLGALFHDVGKSAIDERVLNKPGKLDQEEFDLIKKHPLFGYEQIKQTRAMTKDQLSVVLQHHEALDGSGYPGRLKEWQIHTYARVARIVDIYDALTTRRVYKEALPIDEALRIMNEEMRHTLDTRLFEAFTKYVQKEKKTEELRSVPKLDIGIGTPLQIRFGGEAVAVKGVLAGWEEDRLVMVRVPASDQILNHLKPGSTIATVRYVVSDARHTFSSTLLKYSLHPFPLLFLSYPQSIKRDDPRKSPRTNSFIRVKVSIGKEQHPGAIVDLSRIGCRLAVRFLSGCPPRAIAINERLSFFADFSGKGQYEPLEGIICNAVVDNDKAVLGICFAELSPEISKAIESLCRMSNG